MQRADGASLLIKLALDEGLDLHEGLLGVGAAGVDGEFAAGAGGEHHEADDAFAVDFFAVLFHKDFRGELVGGFDKTGGGPGVDALLVQDRQLLAEGLAVCFICAHHLILPGST